VGRDASSIACHGLTPHQTSHCGCLAAYGCVEYMYSVGFASHSQDLAIRNLSYSTSVKSKRAFESYWEVRPHVVERQYIRNLSYSTSVKSKRGIDSYWVIRRHAVEWQYQALIPCCSLSAKWTSHIRREGFHKLGPEVLISYFVSVLMHSSSSKVCYHSFGDSHQARVSHNIISLKR
jgi:hypothetical protein